MNIEKRSIATCVILSIVTCGIYAIFWAVKLGRESVSVKDRNDDGVLEIVLMIFLPFLGFYFAEKKLTEGCQNMGIPHEDRSLVYLLLGIFRFAIVDYCLMQNDLNKISDMMNPGNFNNPGGYNDPNNFNNPNGYNDPNNFNNPMN